MGIGDWGLGIGDWGLGPIPNPHFQFIFIKQYLIKYTILILSKIINYIKNQCLKNQKYISQK
jgi:hypothetical protein